MAEIRYSISQFEISDADSGGVIQIDQTDFETIQNLRIIEVGEVRGFLLANNTAVRTYQVSYSYLTGTNEGIAIDYKKIETDNSTVGVVRATNVFKTKQNRLPIHALPISTKNDNVTYNLFVPSFGGDSSTQLSAVSLRKTIQFEDENFLQLTNEALPTNSNFGFEMKLVHKAETFSTYDIIGVYESIV